MLLNLYELRYAQCLADRDRQKSAVSIDDLKINIAIF
jgi:hypothetical protein